MCESFVLLWTKLWLKKKLVMALLFATIADSQILKRAAGETKLTCTISILNVTKKNRLTGLRSKT
ncbi:MAG: hypothetical protein ACJASL_005026 [Paraglaciecola sp.]|jgi:hypothetical protein